MVFSNENKIIITRGRLVKELDKGKYVKYIIVIHKGRNKPYPLDLDSLVGKRVLIFLIEDNRGDDE